MPSEVGRTRDAGYQIGVSRTLPYPRERIWDLLTSPDGISLWLGSGAEIRPERGAEYRTEEGAVGETRGYRWAERIRLTYLPPGGERETTVQVALDAKGERTRLVFHQERLADGAERERQRERWRGVMDAVEDALAGGRDGAD